MGVVRSIILFVVAALAEVGGRLARVQGVREHRGMAWVGAGIAALAAYGVVAMFHDDPNLVASSPLTAESSWPVRWLGGPSSTGSVLIATT